jgi:hypothetical protein
MRDGRERQAVAEFFDLIVHCLYALYLIGMLDHATAAVGCPVTASVRFSSGILPEFCSIVSTLAR